MTDKQAAEILRIIAQQNLPTVNGIPFTEIKRALYTAANKLDPVVESRPCEECAHRRAKRTENGTIYGCGSWACSFEPREG